MKKYLSITTISLIVLFTIFSVITPALALTENIPGVGSSQRVSNVTSFTNIFNIFLGAVGWIYRIFFIVAAVFIIIAAFNYLTAQGDPEKVGKAKSMIIYAVIAIVVALLAFSIDQIVATFLTSGGAS